MKSWKKNVISSKISITFDPVPVTYGGIGGRRWGNLVAFKTCLDGFLMRNLRKDVTKHATLSISNYLSF
jgi:hypothetical protein